MRTWGFRPLLTDSDGRGGYHLRVLLRTAAPTAQVWIFLGADAGPRQPRPPQTARNLPKQRGVTARNPCGNWLRLPGRHHKRPHWSRVWDGTGWLEGHQAIDFLLALEGDDPTLLLTPAIEAYQAQLPNLGEGQGRDDVGYQFACWLVRDMALDDAAALPWLERGIAATPRQRGECVQKWLANARQYGQRPIGIGLKSTAPNHRPTIPSKISPCRGASGRRQPQSSSGTGESVTTRPSAAGWSSTPPPWAASCGAGSYRVCPRQR